MTRFTFAMHVTGLGDQAARLAFGMRAVQHVVAVEKHPAPAERGNSRLLVTTEHRAPGDVIDAAVGVVLRARTVLRHLGAVPDGFSLELFPTVSGTDDEEASAA